VLPHAASIAMAPTKMIFFMTSPSGSSQKIPRAVAQILECTGLIAPCDHQFGLSNV
jgi:hypothetical protein